jgi:hypothetical protein
MQSKSRRGFLKKAVYVAPVVLTMNAVPAFAGFGSGHSGRQGGGNQGENNQGENNDQD